MMLRMDRERIFIIATQRPETIMADVAIAVHPEDPRYTNLVGKKVLIPLIDRAIPVIADEYVDLEIWNGGAKKLRQPTIKMTTLSVRNTGWR